MRGKLLLLSIVWATSLSASAQTVEVKEGWNLLGTACKISVESLENNSVRTVWIWDKNENFWKVWSPIQAIMDVAKSYGIETFEEIPAYSGFGLVPTAVLHCLCAIKAITLKNLCLLEEKLSTLTLRAVFTA